MLILLKILFKVIHELLDTGNIFLEENKERVLLYNQKGTYGETETSEEDIIYAFPNLAGF